MDRKAMLLAMYPDAGPEVRAAIEYGVDVRVLEYTLSLTVEERLRLLDDRIRYYEAARASGGPIVASDECSPTLEELIHIKESLGRPEDLEAVRRMRAIRDRGAVE